MALISFGGCSQEQYIPPDAKSQFQTEREYGGGLSGGTISESEWAEVTSKTAESVVLVKVDGCGFTATGTGFSIGSGWVVTNRHVVEDAITVEIDGSGSEKHPVERWYFSETDDLAFLRVADFEATPLVIAEDDAVPGDLVSLVGHPLGGELEVRLGRIFKTDEADSDSNSSRTFVFEVTAEALPGDSGGPAVNTNGQVIGVTFAIDRVENLVMVIPASRLATLAVDPAVLTKGVPCEE